MLETIIGIIAFIFVLGVIILIHEGGHFYFARRANVLCREYAFGMGPLLISKKKGETLYSIRMFPIGGFCAIAGEEVEADFLKDRNTIHLDIVDGVVKGIYFNEEQANELGLKEYKVISYDIFDQQLTGDLYIETEIDDKIVKLPVDSQCMLYDRKIEMQNAPFNRCLGSKTLGQRAMVMFGGPMMNFVLAIIVFLIAGFMTTFPDTSSSQIGGLVEDGPVSEILKEGSTITKMECHGFIKEIKSWDDISEFMYELKSKDESNQIKITYTLDGVEYTEVLDNPQYVVNTLAIASDYKTSKVVIGAMNSVNDKMIKNDELKVGDEILSINSVSVDSWADVIKMFEANVNGDEMKIVVRRDVDGEVKEIETTVKPYSHELYEIGIGSNSIIYGGDSKVNYTKINLGITPQYKFHFGKSLLYTLEKTGDSFTSIFDTLKALTSNQVSVSNLSGPVGIFSLAKTVANQGFVYILNLMGMLSVNIGLLNLLPIPALDGGRLVFLGYEAITKKKPSQKVETALITITMVLLMGLMVFVTFNDVLRLIK